MEISHVIRGEEWLPSTPKHILLYRAFEWKIPLFAHLPLLLNPDRSKLSKRQGDVAVEDYMNKGYLRESLINYVALLGWHPSEDREIFSIKEMEKEFDLQRVNKSGAVFDIEKLNWMNSVYIKEISLDVLFPLVKNYLSQCDYYSEDDDKLKRIIDSIRHTLVLVSDIKINGEIFYRFPDSIDPDALEVIKEEGTIEFLRYVSSRLNETSISSIDEAKGFVKKMGADTKRKGKQLFVPLRVAFTASLSGPGVNEMLFVLGEKQSKIRVDEVINRLGESL
jgi:glutamyl/glutaminyl-tRNA synthetase